MTTENFAAIAGSDVGLRFYEQALRVRVVEETILELSRQGEISGSTHTCVGQECVPVAVVANLDDRDRVVATYRGHGWAMACGVAPVELLAECLGRQSGTNGGRGGSAYLSAPSHGFVGETSIVAAGLPIADGVALALQARDESGVVVVSFGDGATNEGAAHEAIVFAVSKSLPVIFVCENNGWSEMTPIAATVPGVTLHERASGYGLPSMGVDGADVYEVHETTAAAVSAARRGEGPVFVEVTVPRLGGHYNKDIEHYRSRKNQEEHQGRDPLAALATRLVDRGLASPDVLEALKDSVRAEISAARDAALAEPLADDNSAREHVVSVPIDSRSHDAPVASSTPVKYWKAVNVALSRELEERSDVVVFGEDVAGPGGVFGVTRGLQDRFGSRVFDTPIAESAVLGAAVGAALEGLRPVIEIMWADFIFVAFDQLLNQAANVRYMSRGSRSCPIVVRTQQGATPGACAQHSQSLEAVFCHIPGLKVGMPSCSQDAYAMLRAAIADPDPVIVIESRALYATEGPCDTAEAVEPVGGARLLRDGTDLAVVSWGPTVPLALKAADVLAASGIDTAVLDLRWLSPLDEDAILSAAASAGGRIVVSHEANKSGGFGAEVVARVVERLDPMIRPRAVRVATPDVRIPAAPTLQRGVLPSSDSIVQAGLGLLRADSRSEAL